MCAPLEECRLENGKESRQSGRQFSLRNTCCYSFDHLFGHNSQIDSQILINSGTQTVFLSTLRRFSWRSVSTCVQLASRSHTVCLYSSLNGWWLLAEISRQTAFSNGSSPSLIVPCVLVIVPNMLPSQPAPKIAYRSKKYVPNKVFSLLSFSPFLCFSLSLQSSQPASLFAGACLAQSG